MNVISYPKLFLSLSNWMMPHGYDVYMHVLQMFTTRIKGSIQI
jgi:hypothetical protein